MVDIAAQDVKALRDATGAGMMDAKRALVDTNGDHEAASEKIAYMSKSARQATTETVKMKSSAKVEEKKNHEIECRPRILKGGKDLHGTPATVFPGH